MANQRRAHKTLHCTFSNGVAGMYWLEEGVRQDRRGTLNPYVAGLFGRGDGE